MDDYFFTIIKNKTIFKHNLFNTENVIYHLLIIHLKIHTSYVYLVLTLALVKVQIPRSHIVSYHMCGYNLHISWKCYGYLSQITKL